MVHEDELRAIFSALRTQAAPPGSSSATELIRRSRAARSRRRTAAVVGSAVATVAVLALGLALLPEPPSTPVEPGPSLQPTSTTNGVLTTPDGVPGSHGTTTVTTTTVTTTTGAAPPPTR
ncbi:hypothetical protein [Lentzea sp. E54]|uniref:hypothetical protein n=1 Tax=Lentzea xerophila TaxID=3435883 RepID=UPI003DA25D2B